ncbi:hypothetical protein [Hyalangium rubrum]|uniref:Uncharacterized protein n=1 Tax=Hyalangium rubrum TaxID=3103134 RepID=A0ABU5HIY4_9BACT|nr:hypothetical protein [Hyalangium sp. s54d21]MDY7233206.1 hypothetical protein [Hyalangium sp. s54d21]
MTETEVPVPPAFEPTQLSPVSLARLLRALPPRAAALLRRRLVRGDSLEASATFYGVSAEALSLHLLREALALTVAAGGSARAPANADEEEAWARQFTAALERETATVSPALADPVALCRRFLAVGHEVETALEAIESEETASPRRRREDFLRRLAVALLLAVAAYFYWAQPREPEAPPPRHVPTER